MTPHASPLTTYAAARQQLLDDAVRALSADPRFVAAWLGGSHGRGEADAASDLDLTCVVTDDQRDMLCARPWMVGAGTIAPRLAVIRQFGEPVVLHENHFNAPEGGSFTFTLYGGTALMVDWMFVPLSDARQPAQCRVLFAHRAIPLAGTATLASRTERSTAASERVSFFWMLAAVAARRRARGDIVDFHVILDHARRVAGEIQAHVEGRPAAYHRPAPLPLAATSAAQAAALRALCEQVLALMPAVEQMGGHVPPSPLGEIDALLALVE